MLIAYIQMKKLSSCSKEHKAGGVTNKMPINTRCTKTKDLYTTIILIFQVFALLQHTSWAKKLGLMSPDDLRVIISLFSFMQQLQGW